MHSKGARAGLQALITVGPLRRKHELGVLLGQGQAGATARASFPSGWWLGAAGSRPGQTPERRSLVSSEGPALSWVGSQARGAGTGRGTAPAPACLLRVGRAGCGAWSLEPGTAKQWKFQKPLVSLASLARQAQGVRALSTQRPSGGESLVRPSRSRTMPGTTQGGEAARHI